MQHFSSTELTHDFTEAYQDPNHGSKEAQEDPNHDFMDTYEDLNHETTEPYEDLDHNFTEAYKDLMMLPFKAFKAYICETVPSKISQKPVKTLITVSQKCMKT